MKPKELTVRQYAKEEQVDVSTVRRWIAKGAIDVRRTPGGRIRVLIFPRANALKSMHS